MPTRPSVEEQLEEQSKLIQELQRDHLLMMGFTNIFVLILGIAAGLLLGGYL